MVSLQAWRPHLALLRRSPRCCSLANSTMLGVLATLLGRFDFQLAPEVRRGAVA